MPSSRDTSTTRPLIFHVDDDDALRHVAKRLLERRGFRLIEAASATEAVDRIDAHEGPIDALLIDINLPDGWGSTLAQRLLAEHPEMALVYTTGFAGSDPVLAAALADAAHVVMKPYTGDGLAEALRKAIAERS